MALNGISTLPTKLERKLAKISLAELKRQAPGTVGYRHYNVYVASVSPTPHRPWAELIYAAPGDFISTEYSVDFITEDGINLITEGAAVTAPAGWFIDTEYGVDFITEDNINLITEGELVFAPEGWFIDTEYDVDLITEDEINLITEGGLVFAEPNSLIDTEDNSQLVTEESVPEATTYIVTE